MTGVETDWRMTFAGNSEHHQRETLILPDIGGMIFMNLQVGQRVIVRETDYSQPEVIVDEIGRNGEWFFGRYVGDYTNKGNRHVVHMDILRI